MKACRSIAIHPARKLRRLAGLALAGSLLPAAAHAGLLWDLRAVSLAGAGTVGDPKHVALDASAGPGTLINLEMWVVITGVDATINETFQSTFGSIVSSPGGPANRDAGVAGNLAAGNFPTDNLIKGDLKNTLLALWQTGAFNNGAQIDLDGDGDLDVGSSSVTGPAAGPLGAYAVARAASTQDGTGLPPETFHQLANGREFKISDVTFTVHDILGEGEIASNWLAPSFTAPLNEFARASFVSDAIVRNGADTNVGVGAPVTVSAVPEPASAVLLLAGTAMLGLRRRRS